MEQGQQHSNSLLLEPRDRKVKRQVVDAALESLGELRRHHHGSVGVVALAHVEEPGDALERAVVVAVQTELPAAQSKDQGILWRAEAQVCEVISGTLRSVATSDDEHILERTGLDRIHQLVGNAEHRCVSEPSCQRFRLHTVLRRGLGRSLIEHWQVECLVDHGPKVIVGNLRDVVEADRTSCPQAVGILPGGGAQAVRGHQNRPREMSKLLELVAPMRAVMAAQVLELAEPRVAVRRQHLAVRVNIDPLILCLLEQAVQGAQVVPAYEDGVRAQTWAGRDIHRARRAELVAVSGVQHLHDLQIQCSNGKAFAQGFVQSIPVRRRAAPGLRQVTADAVELLVDLRTLRLAVHGVARFQLLGMVEVGDRALPSVGGHLDHAEQVLVPDQGAPGDQTCGAGGQQQSLPVVRKFRRQTGRRWRCARHLRGHRLREVCGSPEVPTEAVIVEIDVRQCRERGFEQ
mmetsp:Transcript_94792/g.267819  ORF Transcript_94792/g.267819 Transcript_94792/m.267819 type:complete len:460 (-) Transcript_94792:398-1777(-)